MEKRDSSNSDKLKLETLIRDYINNTNSNAGIELSNMANIDGITLLNVLDNLGFETDKEMEEYKRAKYDYNEKVKEYAKLEENYNKLEEDLKLLKENSDNYQNLVKGLEPLIKHLEPIILKKVKDVISKIK